MSTKNEKELPFPKAVAKKIGRPAKEVNETLARYSIEPAGAAPSARPLRVVRVAFSGSKTIDEQEVPFDFEWDVDSNGVWGILAEENLVGKSSILQVILWALRGRSKSLTATVKNWIQHVDVTFRVDERYLRVTFDVEDEDPSGNIAFGSSAETAINREFDGTEEFQEIMQEFMLSGLGLEPIPASQVAAGRIIAYDDGWAAYTGAFLTDADSDAIIGEQVGNDLIQRLLQVYIGIPWVRTFFQARRHTRLLEQDSTVRRRALRGLGGKSLEDLESDLADVNAKLEDEGASNLASQQLNAAHIERDELANKLETLSTSVSDAKTTAVKCRQSRIDAEQAVNALAEETAASKFFGLLTPHSCPRCSAKIEVDKLKKEQDTNECSVCTEVLVQADPNAAAAEKLRRDERLKDAKKTERDAERFVKRLVEKQVAAREALDAVGQTLTRLAAAGTAADAGLLQSEKDRLEGMIQAVTAILEAEDDTADDLLIVRAAQNEAEERVKQASISVMAEISEEVTRLAKALGIRDVESVTLKRNAHVNVVKGGSVSKWKDLSPGEKLRLRIATVIALSRGPKSLGMGRHPGLLLIDSPGREEMQQEHLEETIAELVNLTKEYPDYQMFIAMTGVPSDLQTVDTDRIRFAEKGQFLW
ncbi:hypothetical protein SAMN05444141_11141 [Pseudovibrio denitrificans]|uniref:AAA domain-containing protein n=1 Tax=Pseudovibrio denitrificans TaxID=258256 RepID=A0A1I7DV36_9HYPH|nr:hypothetical protein [Pseudovibrio denitrificans]SFU15513.1 hypothetical protein SAMN05444141_11141 [Pseudovibrio denitrificans]